MNLMQGDCLELMKQISDKSVDMILCDLPFGMTNASWDRVIDFELLWKEYGRIIREDGAILLHASQPFTSDLIISCRDWFRCEWIWNKENPTNFANAKDTQ